MGSADADLEELRREARRFLTTAAPSERLHRTAASAQGWDPELWARLTEELGWTALIVPEDDGGLGLGPRELAVLLEEMGRSLLCAPFFATVCLAQRAILRGGDAAQREEHLGALAAGRTGTLAFSGVCDRPTAEAVGTVTTRDGGDYRLSGVEAHVVDGATADLLVVPARAPGTAGREGVSLFVVPADAAGVSREPVPTLDTTRRRGRVSLDGVRVPASARLGEEGEGAPLLERVVDHAAAMLAAEQVGGAEACLDMAVEYAKVRTQFGRPIGSFQAIKHICADMMVQVETARSAAGWAAEEAARDGEGLAEAASSAKAWCSDAFFFCAGQNIQVHGGIGFTWEHDAHLYFKRARASAALLGGAAHHRERVAQILGW